MKYSEEIQYILSNTQDGDKLAPEHLYLVEIATNSQLTVKGEKALLDLYQNVKTGYTKPWFRNIEHMTKDQNGSIFWKDHKIEHFDFDYWRSEGWREAEFKAAKRLETICKILESKKITVTMSTVFEEIDKQEDLIIN